LEVYCLFAKHSGLFKLFQACVKMISPAL